MSALPMLTAATFDAEVKASKTPILVDFTATWCGPCKALAPELEKLAAETDGKLKLAKVDVDQDADLASGFGIMSVPSMLLFKGGQVVWQGVGAMKKEAILSKISSFL